MTRAYYNEINPHAAQWLRNLIAMGMIADGDVDERDIRDILPSELAGYTQCHFFAGIGVWSYALRMAGWPDDRPVWTASPPCQPFSAAGRGGGVADERHLFPHLYHLIRVRRPPNFFGEQVASKDGLDWLDLVQADMEAEDYSGGAFDLCAAGVGAPHIRQRLSLVFRDARIAWASYAARCGWRQERQDSRGCGSRDCTQGWTAGHNSSSPIVELGDCCCSGLERFGGDVYDAGGRALSARPASPAGAVGALDHLSASRLHHEREGFSGEIGSNRQIGRSGLELGRRGSELAPGNTDSKQLADLIGERQERPGSARDRGLGPSHHSAIDLQPGRPGPVNSGWANADWLFCRDGKWRPVESGTFPLVDGSAFRMDSGGPFAGKSRGKMLEGAGNAIVSEQQAHVIAAYLEHEADEIAAFHAAGSGLHLIGDLL